MIKKSLSPLLILALAAGCVPQLEDRIRKKKEKEAPPPPVAETEVAAAELQPGVTQGTIPANQRATMRSGGSSIIVEPGTFAVDVSVTMEEGDSLTGEATSVGVNAGDVAAQGAPLVVTAPEGTAPTQPFTIAMPIPGAGLALLDDRQARLVVLFKVVIPGTGRVVLGVLSGDKLVLDGNNVKFLATRFGSFQVVVLTKTAPPSVEVASATPIVRKRDLPPPAPSGPAPVVTPTLTLAQAAAARSAKGTTGETVVTLTNGAAAATGLVIRVAGEAWSVKEDGCGASLAAGASCNLVLYFTPGAIGKNLGRVFVLHQASGDKEIVSLALDGVGLVAPTLQATFTAPAAPVPYRASAKVAVTVTNGGEVASGRVFAKLRGAAFSLPGAAEADALLPALGTELCGPLAPAASCSFDVDFVSPGAGSFSADLDLAAVGAGKVTVTLDVLGTTLDTLAVAPAYASTAWLDFKARDAAKPTYLQGTPGSCSTGVLPESACFHAGEILRADIPGFDSCDGLRIDDARGAFQWTCHDFGATVALFSTGLRPGKGLRDLVSANAWLENSVTVYASGTPVLRSPLDVWFGNTVSEAPDNPNGNPVVSLGQSGRIWTVPASRLTTGYHFAAPRQALVTLDGVRLGYANDNVNVTSNATVPGSSTCAMLSANGQSHLWIEAELDAYFPGDFYHCDAAIFLWNSHSAQIRGTRIMGAGQFGIRINGSYTPRITDVRVADSNVGIGLEGVTGAVLHRVNLSNSAADGLRLWGGGSHVVTASVATANGSSGVSLSSSGGAVQKVTLSHLTLADNAAKGLYVAPSVSGVEGVGLLASGNDKGIALLGTLVSPATGLDFSDLFLFDNGIDLAADYLSSSLLKGQLLLQDCVIGAAADLNLLDSVCTPTDANVTVAARNGTGSTYRGAVASDALNPTDVDGVANHAATGFDWLSFESPWRAWMQSDFEPGRCYGEECRIVDYGLKSDSPARNRLADFAGGHAPFVSGAACPASAAPGVYAVDAHNTANRFLKHALEQLGDGVGDDDGLCEASERCVYAPAFGAYQGSGNLKASCIGVADGLNVGDVAGVKLQAFESD